MVISCKTAHYVYLPEHRPELRSLKLGYINPLLRQTQILFPGITFSITCYLISASQTVLCFPCCVIVKYSYYLFLTNWDCLVNIHFFSVPTPHLPKAKKQDFRKLLHNNNYTSSTDDNRVSR